MQGSDELTGLRLGYAQHVVRQQGDRTPDRIRTLAKRMSDSSAKTPSIQHPVTGARVFDPTLDPSPVPEIAVVDR